MARAVFFVPVPLFHIFGSFWRIADKWHFFDQIAPWPT
jgi:hypothetical protein